MQIILRGASQLIWNLKWTCSGYSMANPGCGAVLLVEENDLFKTRPGGAYGADEYEVTFECPCCHTWNDLPLKAYGHVERLVLRWPAEKGKIYKPPTTGSGLTAPH